MYPVLILREEAVCLIILLFLLFTAKSYSLGIEQKSFMKLTYLAILHVVFDIITILTVNNTDKVPAWVNLVCHVIFYISALLYAKEICQYVLDRCYPEYSSKFRRRGYVLPIVYVLAIPFMNIEYVECNGTYLSTGLPAYIGYAIGAIYFVIALILLLLNKRKMRETISKVLLPMIALLLIIECIQAVRRDVLFTGGAITIVTVAFFFSLENPTRVMEAKLLTDALTGMGSRRGYEEDLIKYEKIYKEDPSRKFLFAFADINNLRKVNNNFGHHEGDRYISLVSSTLLENLTNAKNIYRIGGDEFLIVYIDTPEVTANIELDLAQQKLSEAVKDYPYIPGAAIGHAVSGPTFETLQDVIIAADEAMYRNKEEMER